MKEENKILLGFLICVLIIGSIALYMNYNYKEKPKIFYIEVPESRTLEGNMTEEVHIESIRTVMEV